MNPTEKKNIYVMNKDISNISGIPLRELSKLTDLQEAYIENCINNKTDENVTIDIGIGILCVMRCDDCVKYKFIPSKNIRNSVDKGENRLVSELESVAKKVTLEAYNNTVW